MGSCFEQRNSLMVEGFAEIAFNPANEVAHVLATMGLLWLLSGFAGVIARIGSCQRKAFLRLFQEMFDNGNHPLLFRR